MYSVHESMRDLLHLIWHKRDELITFRTQHKLRSVFVTVVWADDDSRPVYDLCADTLAKMSAFSASWIMGLV